MPKNKDHVEEEVCCLDTVIFTEAIPNTYGTRTQADFRASEGWLLEWHVAKHAFKITKGNAATWVGQERARWWKELAEAVLISTGQ